MNQNFTLERSIEILERTPKVLTEMFSGLSDFWLRQNEGGETWSPFDVLGHLIHGERTDWMARLKIIFEHGEEKPFVPFDRFAQFEMSKKRTAVSLLEEFTRLRQGNLRVLKTLSLDEAALDRKGRHPELGTVTARQLLATWTAHDLGHIVQVSRVMARQYENEVGPWSAYLTVVQRQ